MKSANVIEIAPTRKLTAVEIVQLILLLLLIIVGIITFFIREIMPAVFIIFSLLLFIMAWTNYKIRKRKTIAVLYVIFGILTAISAILELL